MLPGSIQAVLLSGPPDEGPYNQALFWPDGPREHSMLNRVAQVALRTNQAVIKTRNNTADETGEPLDALACPLFQGGKLFGVFAIEMTNRSQAMQQAAVQQVQAGAKWLETMILLHGASTREQLVNLVELVATGLENETFRVAATEVVNELTKRFSCQRASLGFMRYNRLRVEAISHSTRIDQQTSVIRQLRDAMEEALDQGSTMVYPAAGRDSLFISKMHAQLAQQQSAICTIPLIKGGRAVGALLLERSIDEPFHAETVEQCEQIGLLIGPVLETRSREERALPAKILDSAQRWFGKLFGRRHLPLKVTVALSVGLLVWLSVASSIFSIPSNSILEAGVCQAVVAPQQGYIADAHARAGDLVRAGDLLATLDKQDLLLEQRKWQSQRAQLLKEYRKALAGLDRAAVAILNAKRAQADAQLKLVEQQLQRTTLVAPFSGLVVKGDLSQALGSPVERGEVLYEVAATDSYRVVLQVDDRDIGLVSLGQRGKLKLAGLPEQAIGIEIDRITPVSISGEGRNYFRVEAVMNSHSDLMRPGMEGVARIEIGEEKLLWIWSRRLVEWLRLFAWNRLP